MDIDAGPKVMGDDGEFHATDEAVDLSGTTFEAWVALAIFWLLGAVVFYQFFTRYALNDSASWTEEIARYLLVATVFVAYLMSLCSHAWSAAQYAILTGVMAAAGAIASAASGPLAERLGWTVFYGLTIAASVPGLLLIPAAAALVAPSSQPRAEE